MAENEKAKMPPLVCLTLKSPTSASPILTVSFQRADDQREGLRTVEVISPHSKHILAELKSLKVQACARHLHI
jgi:hypothetical protein